MAAPASTPDRWDLIVLAVAVPAMAAGIAALTRPQFVPFALFTVAGGIVVVALSPLARKRWWSVLASGLLAAVVTTGGVLTLTDDDRTPPTEARISITPPDGPVPRCVTVHGTASVPTGSTVWLTMHGRDTTDLYGFTKVTRDPSNPDQWQARMELGEATDAGKEFLIHAFALDAGGTRLLENLRSDAYYFAPTALAGTVTVKQNYVRDSANRSPC